jgi:hypothetical protein
MPFKLNTFFDNYKRIRSYDNEFSGNQNSGSQTTIYKNIPFVTANYDSYLQFQFKQALAGKIDYLTRYIRAMPLAGYDTQFELLDLPKTVIYDFENGIHSDWAETLNLNLVDVNGNSTGGTFTGSSINAELVPKRVKNGYRIKKFSVYWYEKDDQTGFTFKFLDSSGSELFQAGGNNPQWELKDGDGSITPFNGNGYERWILYEFTFNWGNTTYDYRMRDIQSGDERTGTRAMFRSTDFRSFRIDNSNDSWGSADHMVVDDITLEVF